MVLSETCIRRPVLTTLVTATFIVFGVFAYRLLGVAALPSFAVLLAATVIGCWLFYAIGRSIGWLRPLIGLQKR